MRVLKLCIALVFAHHVVCTALYLSMPQGPIFYRSYVIGYMKPAFLQFWALFAEPTMEYQKVVVRCQQGDVWSEWIDPVAPLLQSYQDNRPWDSGKEYLLHLSYINSVATVLEKSGCGVSADCLENFEKRPLFANGLRAYVHHVCRPTQNLRAISYKMVTVGSVSFAKRSREQQMEFKREIVFPELNLGN